MKIYLIVKFTAIAGKRQDLIEGLRENIAVVRAHEPGCIQCDLIEADGDADASTCSLLEVYASEAAFEAHRAAPYGPDLYARIKPYMDGMPQAVHYRTLP